MSSLFEQRVVVTGAGGSIGSALCLRIAEQEPEQLTLVSLTEAALYSILNQLEKVMDRKRIRPILGSVTDRKLMDRVLWNQDVVIHAAAHKHVPLCQENPVAAVENNVGGTMTLAEAAYYNRVDRFLLISSDKAVRPSSVMGATKRLAERVVQAYAARSIITTFLTVRFGNVMDSAGSVLPRWREQIEKGGPVTVTDPACERFFMTIPEAVELVLTALDFGAGTYILDPGPPRKILEMAKELIGDRDIPIQFTGLRPGEKLTEELYYGGELAKTVAPRIYQVSDESNYSWTMILGLIRMAEDKFAAELVLDELMGLAAL